MEEMMKKIVEIDHMCFQKVEDAKIRKNDITENLNDKKKEIYENFTKEYQETLDKQKHDLHKQIHDSKQKHKEEYLKLSSNMSELYEKHKDEWINMIVERCIQ